MTRDEAIAYGRRVIDLGLNNETQAFCELAIEALKEHQHYKDLAESYEKTINKLTEAIAEQQPRFLIHEDGKMEQINPQQKTGHWIWCAGSHKCSNCGEYTCFSHKKLLKYCPECGSYNGGANK